MAEILHFFNFGRKKNELQKFPKLKIENFGNLKKERNEKKVKQRKNKGKKGSKKEGKGKKKEGKGEEERKIGVKIRKTFLFLFPCLIQGKGPYDRQKSPQKTGKNFNFQGGGCILSLYSIVP